MASQKSIILLSGGLDSVVSLAMCKESHNIELALTFDYGQKAKEYEISASKKIAQYFGLKHELIKLDWLENITKTALVDKKIDTPEINENELDDYDVAIKTAQDVWVPNRNGVFLNVAAAFSDSYGYSDILFGANKEEGTTFPDNTQEFIDEINKSFEYSTLSKPKVSAPLIEMNKSDIVIAGYKNNAPFELVRSCYHNGENHCGKCESCMRLKRALDNADLRHIINIVFDQE